MSSRVLCADVVFLIGHNYCQALDVAVDVTHAIRYLFEYINIFETSLFQAFLPMLIVGLKFYIPPLYSMFH